MKTIFTLLLATIFSSAAFAYDGGKLTITLASNKNLQVYVDGRGYRDDNNSYVLNNIQPGNHQVAIYRVNGNNNGGWGNGNGRNGRYDKKGELVYSSNVYVRQSYHVDVMINRFGKAMVDERLISDRNGNWDDDDWNSGGYNNGGYNNGGYNNGGYNNGYGQAMNESDFNQVLQKIRNQWFGKLGTARDAVTSNYLSTTQVRQVLQIFSAESDKLDLAKNAYKNTVDRQNFRQLYDQFSYAGQSELDRYIRDFRY